MRWSDSKAAAWVAQSYREPEFTIVGSDDPQASSVTDEEIDDAVAAFLASGGEVEVVPEVPVSRRVRTFGQRAVRGRNRRRCQNRTVDWRDR
jgi:hypothetical protein